MCRHPLIDSGPPESCALSSPDRIVTISWMMRQACLQDNKQPQTVKPDIKNKSKLQKYKLSIKSYGFILYNKYLQYQPLCLCYQQGEQHSASYQVQLSSQTSHGEARQRNTVLLSLTTNECVEPSAIICKTRSCSRCPPKNEHNTFLCWNDKFHTCNTETAEINLKV